MGSISAAAVWTEAGVPARCDVTALGRGRTKCLSHKKMKDQGLLAPVLSCDLKGMEKRLCQNWS